jgi:hypothetical protein
MIHRLPPAPVTPTVRVTDNRFEYVRAKDTDVTKTWRRFGWKPLTEKSEECNMHMQPSKK